MADNSNLKTSKHAVQSMDGRIIFKRVFAYITQYKLWFAISLVFLVILSATQVGIAAILEPIINDGVVKKDTFAVQWLPVVMFS